MTKKEFMAPKPTQQQPVQQSPDGCCTAGQGTRTTSTSVPSKPAPEKKPAISTTTVPATSQTVTPTPFARVENAYPHKSNNEPVGTKTLAATSSASSGSPDSDRITSNLQFEPNILDAYDSITYHFKLFITDPETSSTGLVFNTDKQIIIAETGVTDINIDKVEIKSITTPTVESGTGTSTHATFELVEPGGAGLVDRMFYQSLALGIGNWAVMPVYLQLSFRGRDPLTSEPEKSAGSLTSLQWLWALKITNIKAHVTAAGTKYEFEAIMYDEFAQTNTIFELKHNVSLNGLDTFEKAMAELQNKLNADQLLKLINNYSVPDSFRIIVDPEIATYTITPTDASTNPVRHGTFDKDLKSASFVAGTSIDKIIDSLLAQTTEYQQKLLEGSPESPSSTPAKSPMKKFWRIITETRPLTYDSRRQTLANEYIIYVIEYDVGVLTQALPETTEPLINRQRKRLQEYAQKSILKKIYNYIFTGLNDQVKSFDITINNAFASALSRLGGIYSNAAMADKGMVTHDHSAEEARITDLISKAVQFQNNASTSTSKDAVVAMNDAKSAINASKLPDETKNRYKVILDKSKPESRLQYLKDVQAAGGTDKSGNLEESRAKATRLSTPVVDQETNRKLTFISDVRFNSQASRDAYAEFAKNAKGKMRPIAKVESMQDRQIGMGVESDSNSGLQKLSSMFSVALHSGLDNSFQQIKLTIKGDPFWLSPSPYADENERITNSFRPPAEAIDRIKKSHLRSSRSANFLGTDNFFIIRFRTPQVYEGSALEDNSDNTTDVETLSGVYKVTLIVSRFSSGKFEQELDAYLDPEISIFNISDQIENAIKIPTPITQQKSIGGTRIPSTAVKVPKLPSASSIKTPETFPLPSRPNLA